MKITIDSLTGECAKLADILPYVDFKATIEVDEGGLPYIGLRDVQGANLGDVESERFYTAKAVLERLSHYLEDTFLDGEICCNADIDFSSYAEAETYARKNGFGQEGETIRKIVEILEEPDYILCPYNDALYLFTDDELDAAYRGKERMYRLEDARRQIECFIYDEELKFLDKDYVIEKETKFFSKWGYDASLLLGEAETVAERFLSDVDCNVDENTLYQVIIFETAVAIRSKLGGKEKVTGEKKSYEDHN